MSEINEMKLCAEISRLYKVLKIANKLIDKAKAQGRAEAIAEIRELMPKIESFYLYTDKDTIPKTESRNKTINEVNAILDKVEGK